MNSINDASMADWDRAAAAAKGINVAPALERQEGGDHYKSLAIQPIEYILANDLSYAEGNVVKYITRHRAKGGAEDIRKVIHYCQLLLESEYSL